MGEFLLELFSEEIPARMQKKAVEDFNKLRYVYVVYSNESNEQIILEESIKKYE